MPEKRPGLWWAIQLGFLWLLIGGWMFGMWIVNERLDELRKLNMLRFDHIEWQLERRAPKPAPPVSSDGCIKTKHGVKVLNFASSPYRCGCTDPINGRFTGRTDCKETRCAITLSGLLQIHNKGFRVGQEINMWCKPTFMKGAAFVRQPTRWGFPVKVSTGIYTYYRFEHKLGPIPADGVNHLPPFDRVGLECSIVYLAKYWSLAWYDAITKVPEKQDGNPPAH